MDNILKVAETLIKEVRETKNTLVRSQNYDRAVEVRDLERDIEAVLFKFAERLAKIKNDTA